MNCLSLFSRFRVLLLGVALVCAAPAFAQAPTREALADQLFSLQNDLIDAKQMQRTLVDTAARPVFKGLREDADWGPEHPVWKKQFPEFGPAFGEVMLRLQPVILERAKAAVVRDMSEEEISELIAVAGSEPVRDVNKLLAEIGLDSASAVKLVGMFSNPKLYSRAEQTEIKAQLMLLASRERELQAMLPRLQNTLRAMQNPAFQKLQRVMSSVMTPQAGDLAPGGLLSEDVGRFLARWRERVKQD